MAAEYKLAIKNDLSKKFTTTGKSYQEVQTELLRQQQMHDEMVQYITDMVAVLDKKRKLAYWIYLCSRYI